MACATISMAWFSRWCRLTKASEATTTAAAPSLVGQHIARVSWEDPSQDEG